MRAAYPSCLRCAGRRDLRIKLIIRRHGDTVTTGDGPSCRSIRLSIHSNAQPAGFTGCVAKFFIDGRKWYAFAQGEPML